MRRSSLPFLAVLCLALTACSSPSEPTRRSITGQWRAIAPALTQIHMTLTETARVVAGAGSWVTVEEARGFRVTGAHADGSVSLLIDFDSVADVNFRGEFTDEDTMDGVLNGGPMVGVKIQFVRVATAED